MPWSKPTRLTRPTILSSGLHKRAFILIVREELFISLAPRRKTAMNFNPPMCKAGKICIVEVEEIVEVGEIPADQVHVPSIYVQGVLLGKDYEKRIEVRHGS